MSYDEERMDIIGPNGNDGLHYQFLPMHERYPKYFAYVGHLEYIDVYRTHRLFVVKDHEIHHASKKLLLCGVRTGGKPVRKEVEEARDTLNRWLEIMDEDEACK